MNKILYTFFLIAGMIASGTQIAGASSDDESSRGCGGRRGCGRSYVKVRVDLCDFSLARIAEITNAVAATQVPVNFIALVGSVIDIPSGTNTVPAFNLPVPPSTNPLTLTYRREDGSSPATSISLTQQALALQGTYNSQAPFWMGQATLAGGYHASYVAELYGPAPVSGPAPLLAKTRFKVNGQQGQNVFLTGTWQ